MYPYGAITVGEKGEQLADLRAMASDVIAFTDDGKGVALSLIHIYFMHGGAQETKRRAGTENVAGIVGFGKAAEMAHANLEHHRAHCSELRDYLRKEIEEKISGIQVNGPRDHRHPGNLNVCFDYIEGESILPVSYTHLHGLHGIGAGQGL